MADDELQSGQVFTSPSKTLTDAHFLFFSGLTGDNHPIHYDVEYARTTRFGKPLAHGLLLASLTALGASPASPHIEGFVFVEDRAKDMVLRAGENVYCAEVEAVIYEFPGVHEAAVFGVPHARLGEEVACAVYPKRGREIDADALRKFVESRIAVFKVPTIVEVVSEPLPRNAAGKILKRTLRDEMLERRGDPS